VLRDAFFTGRAVAPTSAIRNRPALREHDLEGSLPVAGGAASVANGQRAILGEVPNDQSYMLGRLPVTPNRNRPRNSDEFLFAARDELGEEIGSLPVDWIRRRVANGRGDRVAPAPLPAPARQNRRVRCRVSGGRTACSYKAFAQRAVLARV
jgi:hypothetical protein